jgi:hypothetical protein
MFREDRFQDVLVRLICLSGLHLQAANGFAVGGERQPLFPFPLLGDFDCRLNGKLKPCLLGHRERYSTFGAGFFSRIPPFLSTKHTTYFPVYDRLFGPYRDRPITFGEIGVLSGGSLFMLRSFFGPKARFIGIDLNLDAVR